MANTKNSQAAKIRKQIIAWLQDEQQIEVVSETKFPGIRGIRAVKLRQMLGDQGYVASVVMGAVSAAPSIDHRIKKATLRPREVYYYFVADAAVKPAPATLAAQTAPAPAAPVAATLAPTVSAKAVGGLAGTAAFANLQATAQQLTQELDALLTAAQEQAPLSESELAFLTDVSTAITKQGELLQNFSTQERINQLRQQ